MNETATPVDPDSALISRLRSLTGEVLMRQADVDSHARELKRSRADLAAAKKARDDYVDGLTKSLPLFDGPASGAAPSGYPAVPGTPLTPPERPSRRQGKRSRAETSDPSTPDDGGQGSDPGAP